MLKVWAVKKGPKLRCLRSRERIAQKEHSCYKCICMIFAGEYYLDQVMVYGKRIWNQRCHYSDCPDHPPDEEREAPAEKPAIKPKKVAA